MSLQPIETRLTMPIPPHVKTWLYALACVVVPVLWGLVVVGITNRLERYLFRPDPAGTGPERERPAPPPLEFHI
jgi:hypothetical protein